MPESFERPFAPRNVTILRQQWLQQEKPEYDPIDEEQVAYEEAGFPIAVHDQAELERQLAESGARILGRPLSKQSKEKSQTSPSSTAEGGEPQSASPSEEER